MKIEKRFKNFLKNQKSKCLGSVTVPLLVGIGVVAIVLGVLVLAGRRNREGKFEFQIFEKEDIPTSSLDSARDFEGARQVTVLPTQTIVAGQKVFLTITSPVDEVTVSQNKVTVTGKTVAGADVSVNEKDLTADADGNFSATISLDEGENPILITAGNGDGFEEKEITVYYEK